MLNSRRIPRFAFRLTTARRAVVGFTLLELLVAMAVFLVLALALVTLLNSATTLWRSAESGRRTYELGGEAMAVIETDLEAAQARPPRGAQAGNTRFLADLDDLGRPRLRFIRTLPGAGEADVYMAYAGELSVSEGGTGEYNLHDDAAKDLRALGGLAEVMYVMGPDPDDTTLWRGLRAPTGGPRSFFALTDEQLAGMTYVDRFHPVATGVLYFGMDVWSRQDADWITLTEFGKQSGAPSWDSTTKVPVAGRKRATRPRGFPRQLRITVVIEPPGQPEMFTYLSRDVSAGDEVILLDDTSGLPRPKKKGQAAFFRIGREWIASETLAPGRVENCFRGARGSRPEKHMAGELVSGDNQGPPAGRRKTLLSPLDSGDARGLNLSSVAGLPAGDTESSFIKIEDEWIFYRELGSRGPVDLLRGRRNTADRAHPAGAVARVGHVFMRIVSLPTARTAR